MSSSSTVYPLTTVLNQLASTLSTLKSGVFLIATEQNTSCRFAIERGRITHCTHSRDKGAAAVLSLLQIKQASCAFSENLMLPFRADTAVTHEFCLKTLNLQAVLLEEQTKRVSKVQTDLEPEPIVDTLSANRRNRFYRGGYALGENDFAV